MVATPLALGRGYRFEVNLLGKLATWLLYLGLGCTLVTGLHTDWPRWIFWSGLVLAFVSLLGYVAKARREVAA
jgi:hypothetical protein